MSFALNFLLKLVHISTIQQFCHRNLFRGIALVTERYKKLFVCVEM